jgi:hypothetical protein
VRDFVKRTLYRLPAQLPVGEDFFPKPPGGFDEVYNAKTENAVEVFQRFTDVRPHTGQFGQATLDAMWPYADAYSKWVYRTWTAPKPKPRPLIEPLQGFGSLHRSLWTLFSDGRYMGMSDLGTYNPNSNLPSGAPSDHAVYPAYAFDLGIDPDTGYANPTGRAFFDLCRGNPAVEYVILGDKIASRNYGWVVRSYSGGGHGNHVHVSGIR